MRQTIAVDIDDVLAVHAEAMVAYSNRTYGTRLTIDDYTEHWSEMWQIDHDETKRRADEYHKTDDMAHYKHHEAAVPVLRWLSKHFRLIIVTARRRIVSPLTEEWINEHFEDIFEGIHYAGIWDKKISDASTTATKADICQELGVDYLIDDQPKHCNAAAECGIQAIIFGDYPWTRHQAIDSRVVRCHDWDVVRDYFRERIGK